MSDSEKFKGFINKLVDENEKKYGEEIRAKYGNETIGKSNSKIKGMTEEEYAQVEKLSEELNSKLKEALIQGDPTSALAQEVCELHKQWLLFFWDSYSKEAHKGLAQMYVDDARFTKYYDKIAPGCAVFLRDALFEYCS